MTKQEQKERWRYQRAKNLRFTQFYGATTETIQRVFGKVKEVKK